MPPKFRAACDECHRAKTRCIGGVPCRTCTRLGAVCRASPSNRHGRPKGTLNRKTLARLTRPGHHQPQQQQQQQHKHIQQQSPPLSATSPRRAAEPVIPWDIGSGDSFCIAQPPSGWLLGDEARDWDWTIWSPGNSHRSRSSTEVTGRELSSTISSPPADALSYLGHRLPQIQCQCLAALTESLSTVTTAAAAGQQSAHAALGAAEWALERVESFISCACARQTPAEYVFEVTSVAALCARGIVRRCEEARRAQRAPVADFDFELGAVLFPDIEPQVCEAGDTPFDSSVLLDRTAERVGKVIAAIHGVLAHNIRRLNAAAVEGLYDMEVADDSSALLGDLRQLVRTFEELGHRLDATRSRDVSRSDLSVCFDRKRARKRIGN